LFAFSEGDVFFVVRSPLQSPHAFTFLWILDIVPTLDAALDGAAAAALCFPNASIIFHNNNISLRGLKRPQSSLTALLITD